VPPVCDGHKEERENRKERERKKRKRKKEEGRKIGEKNKRMNYLSLEIVIRNLYSLYYYQIMKIEDHSYIE
jgi:DNA invertase Pin-like site-specific DNA recombinase